MKWWKVGIFWNPKQLKNETMEGQQISQLFWWKGQWKYYWGLSNMAPRLPRRAAVEFRQEHWPSWLTLFAVYPTPSRETSRWHSDHATTASFQILSKFLIHQPSTIRNYTVFCIDMAGNVSYLRPLQQTIPVHFAINVRTRVILVTSLTLTTAQRA